MVGQCRSDRQLDFHSTGIGFDRFVYRQLELSEILLKQIVVPFLIEISHDFCNIRWSKNLMKMIFIKDHANLLLYGFLITNVIQAKKLYTSLIPADQIEN